MYPGSGIGRNGRRLHHPRGASERSARNAGRHSTGRTATAITVANETAGLLRSIAQRGSLGRPSTISPMMLDWICEDPA